MSAAARLSPAFLPAIALLSVVVPAAAQETNCGAVITLAGHGNSKLSYSLAASPEKAEVALVLLPGGPGLVDLDAAGCARKLKGNSLVRTRGLFHRAGFVTALVDAPSNYRGEDGLGGFRLSPLHASDIGRVIADMRQRTKLPIWLVGTSRGTISVLNAASRLQGEQAPDGLVLTSPVTAGRVGGRKDWVAQTVFSVQLGAIKVPVLVVAHANDLCIRTPPALAPGIVPRTGSARKQTVTVKGGAAQRGAVGVEACQGSSAHGFLGQEEEVTQGIVRFVRGGMY